MTTAKVPKPPAGLGPAGRKLWLWATGEWDFLEHEELLLLQACRAGDYCDRLAAEAARGTVTVTNFRGDQVANPAMVESRQQSITLSRLLASLRLPSGEEDDVRPQRRGASRGSYGVRGVV